MMCKQLAKFTLNVAHNKDIFVKITHVKIDRTYFISYTEEQLHHIIYSLHRAVCVTLMIEVAASRGR